MPNPPRIATIPGPGVTNITTPAAVTVDPATATATLRAKLDPECSSSRPPVGAVMVQLYARSPSMYPKALMYPKRGDRPAGEAGRSDDSASWEEGRESG